jgi:glutathione S-transferase
MVALKVFGQPSSTEVARVLTCLFEKDLKFQLIRIDTFKKEHRIPEFLQLQVSEIFIFFVANY